MIVVIDTNVWISALQFAKRRGRPTLALEKAMSEDVIARLCLIRHKRRACRTAGVILKSR